MDSIKPLRYLTETVSATAAIQRKAELEARIASGEKVRVSDAEKDFLSRIAEGVEEGSAGYIVVDMGR